MFRRKILVLLVCFSILTIGEACGYHTNMQEKDAAGMEEVKEYVLYIGLNDKDTYRQIISTKEAKQMINAICTQYVAGYTIVEVQGGWVDEKNMLTQENTLVYYFRGAEESDVYAIMDEVLLELNQNSIMLEEKTVSYTYYDGSQTQKTVQEGGAADDEERK